MVVPLLRVTFQHARTSQSQDSPILHNILLSSFIPNFTFSGISNNYYIELFYKGYRLHLCIQCLVKFLC